MKNTRIYQIILLTTSIMLNSCEKVITFDLKETTAKPVAEVVVNSLKHEAYLQLTLTDDYYDTTGFTPLSNAVATIYNQAGDDFPLEEISPGCYKNIQIPAVQGEEYRFQLKLQDAIYNAVSEMPQAVSIDSVYYTYSNASLFAPEGYRVWAVFSDPPEKDNYFRLKLIINDEPATNGVIYLWKDSNADGSKVKFIFYRDALSISDRFRVELWAIDNVTYDYLFALQNISTGSQNASLAAPANPANNYDGDILGYFTAAAVTSTTDITIQ